MVKLVKRLLVLLHLCPSGYWALVTVATVVLPVLSSNKYTDYKLQGLVWVWFHHIVNKYFGLHQRTLFGTFPDVVQSIHISVLFLAP